MKQIKKISCTITTLVMIWILPNAHASDQWVDSVQKMVIQGQYVRAINKIESLQQFLDKNSNDYLQSQLLKANALKAIGRHNDAFDILKPFDSNAKKYPPELSVRLKNSIGNILAYYSQAEEASKYFEQSMKIAIQSGYPLLYCETLNEIGLLYAIYMDRPAYKKKSTKYFNEALNCLRRHESGQSSFHARLLINLAKTYVMTNHNKSIPTLKKALAYISKFPDTYMKGMLLSDIAYLYEYGKKGKTKAHIKKAYEIYQQMETINNCINDNRLASRLYLRLAGLYEKDQQIKQAMKLTQKSIFHAQQIPSQHSLYLSCWQLARLHKKADNLEKAIKQYSQAIEYLSPIRKQIYNSELTKKNVFDQNIKPVYLELSELYFEMADAVKMNSALYDEYIQQIWTIMDQVKAAELEDIFNDPCVTYHKDTDLKLDDTPESVAIIYFIPFSRQPALIMRLPNGFRHLRLNIETSNFTEKIYQLRKDILDWGNFETNAAELYNLIIAPIYNDLKRQNVKTLVIASDGAMCLIPFSVFFMPDERFLIEEFEIVTIPALHLTRMDEVNRQNPMGLICGLTEERKVGNIRFVELPLIKQEVEDIGQIIPGKVLLNNDYTFARLKKEMEEANYSAVHLATHGEFGSIPEKTFLVTQNSLMTMNDLEGLIKKRSGYSIDLLTLSACQTAIGDSRAAFGLAGIAVKAGANCAVATLWSVDDFASQKIFTSFYRNVFEKKYTKAKAMQQAQLKFFNDPRLWQPVMWSAFLVIGNWN